MFFFSSGRRHTRWNCDWSSDVCSSDLDFVAPASVEAVNAVGGIPAPSPSWLLSRQRLVHFTAQPSAESKTTPLKTSSKIGRASCRERVMNPVVLVALQHYRENGHVLAR